VKMNGSCDKKVVQLPTPAEFLLEVQQLCREWELPEGENAPAMVIGTIVEWLIDKGMPVSYESIVSRFYTARIDGRALVVQDPENWKERILGRRDQ